MGLSSTPVMAEGDMSRGEKALLAATAHRTRLIGKSGPGS